MTDLLVRFGGIDFFGDEPRHEGFNIQTFRGWNDGVDARQAKVDIPNGDGAYDIPSTLADRTVPMTGYCYAKSVEKLGWYRRMLTGLVGIRTARAVQVDVLGEKEWSPGKVLRKPEFDEWGGQPFADWSLEFWFPRPFIFGAEVSKFEGLTGSQITAFHRGNARALPRYVIDGVMGGYTLNGPNGRKWVVTKPVTAGNPHTIDMETGQLTIGDVVVAGFVTAADLWAFPGNNPVQSSVIPTSGSGTVTILVRPTST